MSVYVLQVSIEECGGLVLADVWCAAHVGYVVPDNSERDCVPVPAEPYQLRCAAGVPISGAGDGIAKTGKDSAAGSIATFVLARRDPACQVLLHRAFAAAQHD